MRDQRLVIRRRHLDMDVRRSHRVSAEVLEKAPNRSIIGNGVGHGTNSDEREPARVISAETTAKVLRILFDVLDGIQRVGRVLPDVHHRVGDRRAIRPTHDAVDSEPRAGVWRLHDRVTIFAPLGALDVEGTRTVLAVALASPDVSSVWLETPKTSDSKIISCRSLVLIFPAAVRNSIPTSHS